MDKNKMYWRNRALKAETEIHALKQSLLLNAAYKPSLFERIANWFRT